MSDPKEPVATFAAYDEATAKLYADAPEVAKGAKVFDAWLRKIAVHGGAEGNGQPRSDPDTIERIRDAYHNFVGEYL